MTIVGRFIEHAEAYKSARTRARECARFHAEPVLYELPDPPVFVEPDVRLRLRDGVYVVERL